MINYSNVVAQVFLEIQMFDFNVFVNICLYKFKSQHQMTFLDICLIQGPFINYVTRQGGEKVAICNQV